MFHACHLTLGRRVTYGPDKKQYLKLEYARLRLGYNERHN